MLLNCLYLIKIRNDILKHIAVKLAFALFGFNALRRSCYNTVWGTHISVFDGPKKDLTFCGVLDKFLNI